MSRDDWNGQMHHNSVANVVKEYQRPRFSTPVISLDFSDAVCQVETCEEQELACSQASTQTAVIEETSVVLEVFELCKPRKDGSIARADLAKVLQRHVGQEDDVQWVLELLNGQSGEIPQDVDFFNYWRSMDCFFQERGAFPPAAPSSRMLDVIQGMRRLRDDVLVLCDGHLLHTLSTRQLQGILQGARLRAEQPQYFDEMICSIQGLQSISLSSLAATSYACLREYIDICRNKESCMWEADASRNSPLEKPECAQSESGESEMWEPEVADNAEQDNSPCTDASFSFATQSKNVRARLATDPYDQQPLHELIEIVEQSLAKADNVAHQALARIQSRHDALNAKLQAAEVQGRERRANVEVMIRERDDIESEMAKMRDRMEEVEEVERQRDKYKRQVETLEQQVAELEDHNRSTGKKINLLQTQHSDAVKETQNFQRRSTALQSRCEQLEALAEGSSAGFKTRALEAEEKVSEAEKKALDAEARTFAAEMRVQHLEEELNMLRAMKDDTFSSLKSEAGQDTGLSKRPLSESMSLSESPPETVATVPKDVHDEAVKLLEEQVRLQLAQLQSLRSVRNDLFTASDSWTELVSEGASSGTQETRHCSLLISQLQALLRHTQDVEALLDKHGHGSEDARARCSLSSIPAMAASSSKLLSDSATSSSQVVQEGEALVEKASQDPEWKIHVRFPEEIAENERSAESPQQKDLHRRESQESLVHPSMASTSVGSSEASSIFGEDEQAEEFISPVNGMQVKRSPKVKLKHGAKRVVNVHRLATPANQPGQHLLSPSSADRTPGNVSERKSRKEEKEPSSRHSHREKTSSRHHKSGSSSHSTDKAGDSWGFPSFSGIYSALAGPDEEKDNSSDSDEAELVPRTRSKTMHATSGSKHSSEKVRRSHV